MDRLTVFREKQPTVCNLIIIDNFYENPNEIREFALSQEFFESSKDYPGKRTVSFATEELKNKLQVIIEPFGGKIDDFELTTSNGCFQFATFEDKTWIHSDTFKGEEFISWGGLIYLTPDAPLSSGTGFYKFKDDGSMNSKEKKILNSNSGTYSQDYTRWELVDKIGNIFNRLILFNGDRYHASLDYFGDNKYNGRLFQVFFFTSKN